MTWIRLDDSFASHRKVRRCSDAAFRLHVSALCWASRYLTDGYIASDDVELVGDDLDDARDPKVVTDAAAELVRRGMWHTANHDCPTCPSSQEAGWIIHDYLEINPSANQIQHQRRLAAERQRRARERAVGATEIRDGQSEPRNGSSRRDSRMTNAPVTRQSRLPTPTPIPNRRKSPTDSFSDHPKRSSNAGRNDPNDPPEFETFWKTYPRHEAKAAARKAWIAATAKAEPAQIIAAAAAYRDKPDREARYTAHASTWLNQERWADQPDPPGTPANGHRPYFDDPNADYHAEL